MESIPSSVKDEIVAVQNDYIKELEEEVRRLKKRIEELER